MNLMRDKRNSANNKPNGIDNSKVIVNRPNVSLVPSHNCGDISIQ